MATLRDAPPAACHALRSILCKYKIDIDHVRFDVEDAAVRTSIGAVFGAEAIATPGDGHMVIRVADGASGAHSVDTAVPLDRFSEEQWASAWENSVQPMPTKCTARGVVERAQATALWLDTLSAPAKAAFTRLQTVHPQCAREFAIRSGCISAVRHFAGLREAIDTAGAAANKDTRILLPGFSADQSAQEGMLQDRPALMADGADGVRLFSCGRHLSEADGAASLCAGRAFCPLCDGRFFEQQPEPFVTRLGEATLMVTDDDLLLECLACRHTPDVHVSMVHDIPANRTFDTLVVVVCGETKAMMFELMCRLPVIPKRIHVV